MRSGSQPRPRVGRPAPPSWIDRPLDRLDERQWERLCDGCARCCLLKLEDIDTGEIAWTDIACHLLDRQTCRCTDYRQRTARVPDCVSLDPETVRTTRWLPPTCAYRLRAEGRGLPSWHPLLSGSPRSVLDAGISVHGRTVSETDVDPDRMEDHIVDWPHRDEGA